MATVCPSKFSVNTLLSTSPTSSESRFPVRLDTVRVDTCAPYLRDNTIENRSAEGKVATRGILSLYKHLMIPSAKDLAKLSSASIQHKKLLARLPKAESLMH